MRPGTGELSVLLQSAGKPLIVPSVISLRANAAPPQGLAFRLEERVAVVANGAADPIYATGIVWDVEPVVWTADEVLAGSAAAATGQR